MATETPIESGSASAAQYDLDATTLADVYTCTRFGGVKLTSIVVCNLGSATTFRISIAYEGATDDPSQYLYYDTALDANDTKIIEFAKGKVLDVDDVVRAYAGHTNVTIQVETEPLSNAGVTQRASAPPLPVGAGGGSGGGTASPPVPT